MTSMEQAAQEAYSNVPCAQCGKIGVPVRPHYNPDADVYGTTHERWGSEIRELPQLRPGYCPDCWKKQKKNCQCAGDHSNDWIKRLIGHGYYVYNVEEMGNSYAVARYPRNEFPSDQAQREVQYMCGGWGKFPQAVTTHHIASPSMERYMRFASGIEADNHARRIRTGLPHKWPLWAGLLFAVLEIGIGVPLIIWA